MNLTIVIFYFQKVFPYFSNGNVYNSNLMVILMLSSSGRCSSGCGSIKLGMNFQIFEEMLNCIFRPGDNTDHVTLTM